MPAKSAWKQRRRKASEAKDAKDSPHKKTETETAETSEKEENAILICDGEAVGVWDTLDFEEKQQVLSVTAAESNMYENGAQAIKNVSVKDVMRAVRMQFVTAMQHKGVLQGSAVSAEEIVLLSVFEAHLNAVCTRKVLLSKIYLFTSFVTWGLPLHWFLRLMALGLISFAAMTGYPLIQSARKGLVLIFDDNNDHRLKIRAYGFLSGVYVLASASWVSWYKVVAILVLLPLILVEVERCAQSFSKSNLDQVALQYISWGLLIISQSLTLYFSWHSYFSFLFMFFFFFPTLGSLGLCALGLSGAFLGKGILIVQSLFQDLVMATIAAKLRVNNLWVCLVTLIMSLLLLYLSWASWLCVIMFWSLGILALPCLFTELVAQACQLLAAAALTKYYVGTVLQSGLVIGVLLIVGGGYAVFGAAKKLWTRFRDRQKFGRSIDDD